MSESEDFDQYAYSSEDEDYHFQDADYNATTTNSNKEMDWTSSSENPNAAPTTMKLMRQSHAVAPPLKSGIRMMGSDEARVEMNARVKDVADVLGVPTSAAALLLCQHHWSKEELLENYMNDSDLILKNAGVYHRCGHELSSSKSTLQACRICFDETDTKLAMPCGHAFCLDCWSEFCKTAILQGPICVVTSCPHASCTELVTETEIAQSLQTTAPDLIHKYHEYQLESYVDSNPLTRWCPGRGCARIARAPSRARMEVAQCDACLIRFCVVCAEEPHAPVRCKELGLWNEKCKNESETANCK
jgi:ariadne-1